MKKDYSHGTRIQEQEIAYFFPVAANSATINNNAPLRPARKKLVVTGNLYLEKRTSAPDPRPKTTAREKRHAESCRIMQKHGRVPWQNASWQNANWSTKCRLPHGRTWGRASGQLQPIQKSPFLHRCRERSEHSEPAHLFCSSR